MLAWVVSAPAVGPHRNTPPASENDSSAPSVPSRSSGNGFLVVHGLIHVMGFEKAFAYAGLPGLTVPISPTMGGVWLGAAGLFLASAIAIYACPRAWWLLGLMAVAVSLAAIVPSWIDAKAGAIANVVVLGGVVFGALAYGPTSLRAAYDRDVVATLAAVPGDGRVVTDADLAPLPAPVQRYLRGCGVVGQRRVRSMAVRMHGRIRSAPDAAWMPFSSEQHNTLGYVPTRLFYMTATRAMVPMQGYHRFAGAPASMVVKAAAVIPVVDVSGAEMTRSETVTLFNDLAIMAPAALIDPRITWDRNLVETGAADRDVVRARFTHLGHTVTADLVFGVDGMLVDFVSDDRSAAAADGTAMTRRRWSTPVRDSRSFGSVRLASTGEARWHDGSRSWAYLELTIDDVTYNVP